MQKLLSKCLACCGEVCLSLCLHYTVAECRLFCFYLYYWTKCIVTILEQQCDKRIDK
jgi:hypothetical protein